MWHSVFLSEDGSVLTCGKDNYGQLGREGNGSTFQEVELPVELDPLLVAYHQVVLGEAIIVEELLGLANCCSQAQLEARATGDEARVESEELSVASPTLR